MIRKVYKKISRAMSNGNPRAFLLKYMANGQVGAEIGVWKGEFSEMVLKGRALSKYYLIDPWMFQNEYPRRLFGGKVARSQPDMDGIFEAVKRRLAAYPCEFLRKFSSDAAADIPDSSLDFVYIDGNHSFEYVLEDMEMYFKKLKVGGFMMLDDLFWKDESGSMSVKAAIAAFMSSAFSRASVVEIRNGQAVIFKFSQ